MEAPIEAVEFPERRTVRVLIPAHNEEASLPALEERRGETVLKPLTARVHYRMLQRSTRVPLQIDTGDFRLLSRRALEALRPPRGARRGEDEVASRAAALPRCHRGVRGREAVEQSLAEAQRMWNARHHG